MLVSEEEFIKYESWDEKITRTELAHGVVEEHRIGERYTNEKKQKRIINLITMINNKPKMLEALKKELEKEINL